MPDHTTDRRHLVTTAYGTGANLAARQSIYRYQQPQLYFADWALDQVEWNGVEAAIDVGCGNGAHLRRLSGRVPRLLGLDLSHGMLAEMAAGSHGLGHPPLAVADVQALPLRDASADVVLAMHMLYHVPDIVAAVRELRRVLRPGGVLLAATNGERHLRELSDLLRQAVAAVGGDASAVDHSFLRFTAENGDVALRGAFPHVEWRPATSTLVVPEVGPVLEYLTSMRGWVEYLLPAGATWEQCLTGAQRIVHEHIAAEGAFRVATVAGVFVCS